MGGPPTFLVFLFILAQTGARCWPLLSVLWKAITHLIKPWCAEGEVATAANLNLYRGWKSCVGWHSDDEPLFGKCGDAAVVTMVTSWSWMVDVRTCFFIVRILVRNRIGLTFRSVGSDDMLLPVPCGQEWHVVYQRVRRVGLVLLRGVWGVALWGILGAPWSSVHMGSAGLAGLHPHVYSSRFTQADGGRCEHFLRGLLGVHWWIQALRFMFIICVMEVIPSI